MEYTFRQVQSRPDKEGRCRIVLDVTWDGRRRQQQRFRQVVAHLDAYRAEWPLLTLTRKDYLAYMAHVAGLGLVDSTTSKHVKFLRECFCLAGLPLPSWLTRQVRYGRSPDLQAAELR